MPKKPRPSSPPPSSDAFPDEEPERPVVETETLPPENGSEADEREDAPPGEPPARMKVQIEGTANAVRNAARKVSAAPVQVAPVAESADERPPDETDRLLADGRNMVVVVRQFPKTVEMEDGSKRRCAVKLPDRYQCPTSREEIENDVFGQHGGWKYKCTIHPATTNGESTLLGYFTIEHPNPDEPPYFDDDVPVGGPRGDPRTMIVGNGQDPTLRETDSLVKLKESLERRLERARTMKEIKDLERVVKEAEAGDEPKPVPMSAPTGPDPRDQTIAELKAALAKKDVDDRFAALQTQLAETNRSILALADKIGKPSAVPTGQDPTALVNKLIDQSNQHSKDMLDLFGKLNRPSAPVAPVGSAEENFDKLLDRFAKMKQAFGGDDSRVSKLQDQLIETAIDRLWEGPSGDGDDTDAVKLLIKEAAPIFRTYVEKKIETDTDGGSKEISEDRRKQIYEEAAAKAAADLTEQWRKEGIIVKAPPKGLPAPGGGGKPAPTKKVDAKIVERRQTPQGTVTKVVVEPADLSGGKKLPSAASESKTEEADVVKYADMPGVGRVEVPAQPGSLKYDRRRSVNFVLDSIVSEIHEGVPARAAENPAEESCVPGDALELLDDEVLEGIWKATSGEELEKVLAPWAEPAKIEAVKTAGKDPKVEAWLRRIIKTVGDVWRDSSKK